MISRNGADSRHTERESEFPESVPGTRAGLPLMDQERLTVIYGITVCVRFRLEKDTTVICQHRIISERDIFIREILKPLPETERSLLEAKVPAVKRRTSCVYADLRELISEMELRKAA